MFVLRIYTALLSLTLCATVLLTKGTLTAEMFVVPLPLLYMILEMREELRRSQPDRRTLPGPSAK